VSREQNLNLPLQKLSGRRVARTDSLCIHSFAPAVQTGRNNTAVIEYKQISRAQKFGEIPKVAIRPFARGALYAQHSGSVAGGKGLLSDEFRRQIEVEVRNQHV
jgi:hypothetical protein